MDRQTRGKNLSSLEDTEGLGRRLAGLLIGGLASAPGPVQVIALSGQLGAGKTTLVKAIGGALGVTEVIASPTFTMLNEYHSGRLSLYHFDFYRIKDMAERSGEISLDLMAVEFDEILRLEKAVIIIEWPEQFLVDGREYLDSLDHLKVTLSMCSDRVDEHASERRNVTVSATGPRSSQLMNGLEGTCL